MLSDPEIERTLKEMVIRPIKSKDFDQVLELFSEAFKNKTMITGVDVQRYSRIAKLYRLVEIFLPVSDFFHKDFETILVAVSGDRLIGEIHVVPHGKDVWSLDSSAVDTNFRRRGVYDKLLNESLRYIFKRHGEQIVTSLWTTNVAPVKMTNRLKFEVFETQVLLRLEQCYIPTAEFDKDVLTRDVKLADLDEIYRICRILSPKKMKAYRMAPQDFRDSILSRLMSKITWSHSKKWVIEVKGKIFGYAHVTFIPPEETGKIESFYVLPSDRSSELTSFLLHEVLKFLANKNIRMLITCINEERRETIEIFKSFGFKPIASVYEMVRKLV
jgi:ribosomal protein S18 acetylase RimI-like enzyme